MISDKIEYVIVKFEDDGMPIADAARFAILLRNFLRNGAMPNANGDKVQKLANAVINDMVDEDEVANNNGKPATTGRGYGRGRGYGSWGWGGNYWYQPQWWSYWYPSWRQYYWWPYRGVSTIVGGANGSGFLGGSMDRWMNSVQEMHMTCEDKVCDLTIRFSQNQDDQ